MWLSLIKWPLNESQMLFVSLNLYSVTVSLSADYNIYHECAVVKAAWMDSHEGWYVNLFNEKYSHKCLPNFKPTQDGTCWDSTK